jgi:hypothetical protein
MVNASRNALIIGAFGIVVDPSEFVANLLHLSEIVGTYLGSRSNRAKSSLSSYVLNYRGPS